MTFSTEMKTIWYRAKANPTLAFVAIIADLAIGAIGALIVCSYLGVI